MNTWKIVGVGVLVVLGLLVINFVCRGYGTASRMADKTIFNPEKHIWSYEEFHKQHNVYKEYAKQVDEAESQLAKLEAKGITSGQRYEGLSMEATGARQMMHRIAEKYNAMSEIAYQKIWKSKGLPDRLGKEQ